MTDDPDDQAVHYPAMNPTATIIDLHVTTLPDGRVTATGQLPEGRSYYAVAGDLTQLRTQIVTDAALDNWPAWALHIPDDKQPL